MSMNRRTLLVGAAAAATATIGTIPAIARAQPVGGEPIKWIIPYPPGGGTDRLARVLSEAIQPQLKQPLVIDYKLGAGTIIGAQYVSRARPDGTTLLSVDNSTLVYNPFLKEKLPYDPVKSFTPIGLIGRFPMVLVVHPSVPANTLAEFIAYTKSKGDALNYSSPGIGTPHHLNMEMLKKQTGVQMKHVPYNGGAPSVQAVLANEVTGMVLDLVTGLEFMRSGKMKPIVLATKKRAAELPSVPTTAEAGFPGLELYAWQGMVAPAGLSNELQANYNRLLNSALGSEQVKQQFDRYALEIMPGTPERFWQFAESERKIWGALIREKGIVAE